MFAPGSSTLPDHAVVGADGRDSALTRALARRARHRRRSPVLRILTVAAGAVVCVIALVLLLVPELGLPVLVAGLGLLALEFDWAARALARLIARVSRVKRWLLRRPTQTTRSSKPRHTQSPTALRLYSPMPEEHTMSQPAEGMTELELKRTPGDRRLYALEGIGTLRLLGLASRTAIAETADGSWRIARRGFWRRVVEATDAAGAVVGEFTPHSRRRGGTLRWAGRELALRPASRWRERYALADGDRELVIFDGKGWGRRPVKLTLDDAATIPPALLLFAAYVVRGLAADAAGSSAAIAATTGA
jgi:hypothetical protein